eukprot:scaffold105283_cov72-Phaeocystis_antarctica.AAC.1
MRTYNNSYGYRRRRYTHHMPSARTGTNNGKGYRRRRYSHRISSTIMKTTGYFKVTGDVRRSPLAPHVKQPEG